MARDVYVKSCPANVNKTRAPVQTQHFTSLKMNCIHRDS
jgi:hypothetical protein